MIITSESVTEGHPDKICDNISDAILDNMLKQDPDSRCAVETATKNGMVILLGEIRTEGYVDFQKVTRDTLKKIGYTDPKFGIDHQDCAVLASVQEQSPDIAQGVDSDTEEEQGAGDQGMMYGYATDETPELMPLPITLAHKLTKRLAEVRTTGKIPNLGPDGKSQVSVEYENNRTPKRVTAVVIAQQHTTEISEKELREAIMQHVITPVIGDWTDEQTKYHINATGKFVIGGPEGDAGLTGRKIIVDTYGGVGSHGGGAFSGKDASKVDRSGAYAARWVAKNVVAAGLAKRCEIQLSYAIGVAAPISIYVDTQGTGKVSNKKLQQAIEKAFDLRPGIIIKDLGLKKPIFSQTAAYGHFGRKEFPWEATNKTEELKKATKD
ncbi:methionine adenosyltransferase [Candidatus Woesearchaeota archaeon]|nr:methionine adenosyltransferase [Candidatus Woesearchaeota archaeon]